jgi:hypothetical protein
MAYLHFGETKHISGKIYYYIWECTAYKTLNGTSNHKVRIGHYDPIDKIAYFSNDYLSKLDNIDQIVKKLPVGYKLANNDDYIKLYSRYDVINSQDKEFGFFHLMREIADQIGLKDSLSSAIPSLWKEIFMLSCFLVSSGEPFQHCSDWINASDGFKVGEMSSQYISYLLQSINDK